MLSRHWRLWLSFPSPGPPPEERLAFELCGSSSLGPPERLVRFPIVWLWSRRLTAPSAEGAFWRRFL